MATQVCTCCPHFLYFWWSTFSKGCDLDDFLNYIYKANTIIKKLSVRSVPACFICWCLPQRNSGSLFSFYFFSTLIDRLLKSDWRLKPIAHTLWKICQLVAAEPIELLSSALLCNAVTQYVVLKPQNHSIFLCIFSWAENLLAANMAREGLPISLSEATESSELRRRSKNLVKFLQKSEGLTAFTFIHSWGISDSSWSPRAARQAVLSLRKALGQEELLEQTTCWCRVRAWETPIPAKACARRTQNQITGIMQSNDKWLSWPNWSANDGLARLTLVRMGHVT